MTSFRPAYEGIERESAAPTKLWNRGHATARLEEEMRRAEPQDSCTFSILLVQFDGLSEADRLGDAFADNMLKQASAVLTQVVGTQDMCCRLGGDDFLLILGGRRPTDCQTIIERIQRRWSERMSTRESTVEVSIGVAAFPQHGRTIESLLSAADEAMQFSKMQNEMLRNEMVPEVRAA